MVFSLPPCALGPFWSGCPVAKMTRLCRPRTCAGCAGYQDGTKRLRACWSRSCASWATQFAIVAAGRLSLRTFENRPAACPTALGKAQQRSAIETRKMTMCSRVLVSCSSAPFPVRTPKPSQDEPTYLRISSLKRCHKLLGNTVTGRES